MILNTIIILGVLSFLNLLIFPINPKLQRISAVTGRTFIGLVFMFSGFVKGVDPLGTMYKIEDYFIAYGTEWAIPAALTLSVLLCAAEFSMGALLFFNLKTKINVWLVTGMMLTFTIITLFDALYSPVPDCGCFGDALILTNWETFYKNLVINLFLLPVIFYRNLFKAPFSCIKQWGSIVVIFGLFIAFILHNYHHLPLIDFSNWKIGQEIYTKNPVPAKFFVTYKNKESGKTKEYLSPNYPFNDSVWMSEWEFMDSRVEDPNRNITLFLEDKNGEDHAEEVLMSPDYHIIITSHTISKADKEGFEKIKTLYSQAQKAGINTVVLSGGTHEEFDQLKAELKIPASLPFYSADDIELKIMVRSNPGIMLIKDGVILGKWHHNDTPNISEMGIK